MKIFQIEDEFHSEIMDSYPDFHSALEVLKEYSKIPFGEGPNRAPCSSWKDCQREWFIYEYENSTIPYKLISSTKVLEINPQEFIWHYQNPE